jgi:hypothetical protein
LIQGERFQWDPDMTTDDRALEDPSETFYRASTWYHTTQLILTITFDEAYAGDLHLYAFDWSTHKRRQTVTVEDGNGSQAVVLSSSFKQGAWMHFTVDVDAADTVTITVDKSAGANAVIAGIFLGGAPAAL